MRFFSVPILEVASDFGFFVWSKHGLQKNNLKLADRILDRKSRLKK